MVALGSNTHRKDRPKSYAVKKITGDISLSGKGDDLRWRSAQAVSDFNYPWEKAPPLPTTFKALHNGDWLYGLFEIQDPKVYLSQHTNEKTEVAASSRAEIFFKIDDHLTPYYCLEIDPTGRVMDYKASYYRQFDMEWSWPKGHLLAKTTQTIDGYSIEIAISKKSLKELGLLNDKTLQVGLYRADCFPQPQGPPEFKWISWEKPDSKTPDFHIPSSFGLLQLEG